MAIPPPPPGFRIVSGGGSPMPNRPILRRGRDPQARIVQDGQIIDPNTGTASPIANFQPKANNKTADEAALDQINLKLKQQELAEKMAKGPTSQDLQGVATDIRNVLDNVFRAKEISRNSWTATGFGAPAARMVGKLVGGNDAAALQGKLDTIGSNAAFDRLQKMRDASPTGGALGAISERELALLQSTIASLSPDQPDEDFQGSMQAIADAYGRVLSKLPGGRKMMIERGWLPKNSKAAPKAAPKRQAQPRVVDFNDLPE